MYTGFSAAMVRPQGTPLQVPSEIVPPFTSFNAWRKKSGGFSRPSTAWLYTAPGQFVLSALHAESAVFASIAACGVAGKSLELEVFRLVPVPVLSVKGSGAVM